MLKLGPEILLPGHGFPVIGADRVVQALTDTAELLESLLEQTLALMNEGARLDEILHTVEAPKHLLERPYLSPVYDEPEFVVRNIWRLYGGWYDGDPSSLKPARSRDLAEELASLAGGAGALADRARALAEASAAPELGTGGVWQAGGSHGAGSTEQAGGTPDTAEHAGGTTTRPFSPELRLAGHLAEMAILADPSDPGIRRIHSEVFALMAATASSTMAKGLYSWAATGSDHPETSSG
jgi:alkyl sulfatase BDS1-like metallo-beta-lactamase superfamily hydrolase